MGQSSHSDTYLAAAAALARAIDPAQLDAMASGLAEVRERGGRLFMLGVGGGAGHASHAVNDFRKLCALESYAPTDNVSELTARTNDDGWETSFSAWLEVSRLCERDALLVFSVGGGSREHNVSVNLVRAMETGARGRRVALRCRRSPRRDARRARRHRDPRSIRRRRCARRWSSPSRPSSGTRSSRIPGWPSSRAHWESLRLSRAVRDASRDAAGRVPRSGRRPQRAGRRSRSQASPSRRCGSRTCGWCRARPRQPRAWRELATRWCASPTSRPRRRARSPSRQLLAVHERVTELLRREGVTLAASRLCPHHPQGVVAGARGAMRVPQAGPGHAAGRSERARPRPRELLDGGRHRCGYRRGQSRRMPDLLIQHPGSIHKRLQVISPDAVADSLDEGVRTLGF